MFRMSSHKADCILPFGRGPLADGRVQRGVGERRSEVVRRGGTLELKRVADHLGVAALDHELEDRAESVVLKWS